MGASAAAVASAEGDDPLARSLSSRYTEWVVDALSELPDAFLITDPSLPGHPIVFASPLFLRTSGYLHPCELLGRNARIFQGPATDRRAVAQIREAIRLERPAQLPIFNYTKAGRGRWILFSMFPVFAPGGAVAHFVSVHVPLAPRPRPVPVPGTCRGELCGEGRAGACFSDCDDRVLEAEELFEASDMEREKATSAANNILSALTRYSELTGRKVSGKRNNVASVAPLSSSLIISLGRIKESFVLTDPHLPDMPIVYASDAFLRLTGYARDEVLGRNCRLLNGCATDVDTLNQIRVCVQASQNFSNRILIYRKDGTPLWNLLLFSPVRNATGKIAFHIWVYANECEKNSDQVLSPQMRQLGAVGAVKVAVRSISLGRDS